MSAILTNSRRVVTRDRKILRVSGAACCCGGCPGGCDDEGNPWFANCNNPACTGMHCAPGMPERYCCRPKLVTVTSTLRMETTWKEYVPGTASDTRYVTYHKTSDYSASGVVADPPLFPFVPNLFGTLRETDDYAGFDEYNLDTRFMMLCDLRHAAPKFYQPGTSEEAVYSSIMGGVAGWRPSPCEKAHEVVSTTSTITITDANFTFDANGGYSGSRTVQQVNLFVIIPGIASQVWTWTTNMTVTPTGAGCGVGTLEMPGARRGAFGLI